MGKQLKAVLQYTYARIEHLRFRESKEHYSNDGAFRIVKSAATLQLPPSIMNLEQYRHNMF